MLKFLPFYAPETGNGAAPASDPAPAASPPGMNDLIDFDPFEPGNGPGEEASDAAPAAEPARPPEEQPAQGDALPPQPATTTPQTSPQDPVQAQLAQIAALLAERERLEAARTQREQGAGEQPTAPRFSFQVPSNVAAAMASEVPEERAQGLNALVNGLANSMYAEIAREFSEREQRLVQLIPRLAERTVSTQTEQQRLAQDFYGKYKDLDSSPEMRSFVFVTAQQMASELQAQGRPVNSWTPEFRDAVASRVYGALGRPIPGQTPVPKPTNGQRAPAKPSFASGTAASRGGGPQAPNKDVADIWDTMDYI